jgi:hypothetical protein
MGWMREGGEREGEGKHEVHRRWTPAQGGREMDAPGLDALAAQVHEAVAESFVTTSPQPCPEKHRLSHVL